MTRRRAVLAAAGAAIALLAAGCTTSGLAFRQDRRVTIESPDDREQVSLPFTVTWTADDLDVARRPLGPGVTFAVFVDRPPMRPGQNLRSLADDACKRTPGCPDRQWLADRFVYLTTDTSLAVDRVPLVDRTNRQSARDAHDVTIVLLDGEGRRMGEAAYRLTVFVPREG